MNKFKYYIGLAAALSVLTSCGRTTEEEGLQLQSLPVVFSVITPSQPVQLTLNKTIVQHLKNDSIYYPEATVFMCGEDKKWVELSRQSYEKAVYRDTDNKIQVYEGKNYYLRIELADRTITAQTKVPIQRAKITEAEFVLDEEQSPGFDFYKGTVNVKLELYKGDPCVLYAYSSLIETENSTFLQQNIIKDWVYLPDSISSFDLRLLTFDPLLAKYWSAKEIAFYQNFSEGDITVFIGTFNGLLPPYSNIVNAVGLFGSYAADTKNVKITQP